MKRPNIHDIKTGKELKLWYWLKQELVDYCKLAKINYSGSKFNILERIANKIDGKQLTPKKHKPTSTFNWSKATLTLHTIITDSYKSGNNTRTFFQEHCGASFHFNIAFMRYMKENCGKTLGDAVKEWERLQQLSKDKTFKSDIPSGNQYNQYIRDFFADNKHLSLKDAQHFWKLKKNLPLGKHIYEKTDLTLK
jgi:hypothetical protein